MVTGKYISIKSIMSEITKYPYMEGLSQEEVATYLADLLRLIGAPLAFKEEFKKIEIKKFRGELPTNLIQIQGVRYLCGNCNTNGYVPLKYATDIYKSTYHCDGAPDLHIDSDLSYSLNDNYIITSFEEGQIEMVFKTIQTDGDGLPMIPDNAKVVRALKYYILFQYGEPARFRKEIDRETWEEIKVNYFTSVAAASNSLNMPSMDQTESMNNTLTRLIQTNDWHSRGWAGANNKENIRKY